MLSTWSASTARRLYLYAEDEIRSRADAYLGALRAHTDDFEVLYASKAAPITAIERLLAELGLSIDVASGGELHMALRAGFDPARIYMHGNNKTEAELRYAIEAGIGHVIVDSFAEIDRLDSLLDRPQDVLHPGHARRSSHHPFLRPDRRPRLEVRLRPRRRAGRAGVAEVLRSRHLRLVGLHAHIGSQILELDPFAAAVEALGRPRGLELGLPGPERRRRARDRIPLERRATVDRVLRRGQGAGESSAPSTRCRGS